MKVLLIDVDSKIPNLALMKISAYHKSIGDEVGFNISQPDKIYASIIFNKNRHAMDGLSMLYPDAEIDIGGGGYDLMKKLPDNIENITPDYSLYGDDTIPIGFTTRGCIRKCPFCIVWKKEGKFHRLYDSPSEALNHIIGDNTTGKVILLDNNILADKEWFMALADEIIKRNLKVEFSQGLDIRLLDEEIAQKIAKMKSFSSWKFAFDSMNYKDAVLKGIKMLNDAGFKVRSKALFYVYCNDDESVDDAVERCRILKSNNATAYSMINADVKQTDRMKALKRWTRPWYFWSCDYDEFENHNRGR